MKTQNLDRQLDRQTDIQIGRQINRSNSIPKSQAGHVMMIDKLFPKDLLKIVNIERE